MPASYELVSQRKGYKRYKSPRLVELLCEHAAAQEQREAALSSVLQVSACCTVHGQWDACLKRSCPCRETI